MANQDARVLNELAQFAGSPEFPAFHLSQQRRTVRKMLLRPPRSQQQFASPGGRRQKPGNRIEPLQVQNRGRSPPEDLQGAERLGIRAVGPAFHVEVLAGPELIVLANGSRPTQFLRRIVPEP